MKNSQNSGAASNPASLLRACGEPGAQSGEEGEAEHAAARALADRGPPEGRGVRKGERSVELLVEPERGEVGVERGVDDRLGQQ